MKKFVMILMSLLFLVGCQEVSIYQQFGNKLTQFGNGNVIENSATGFAYQLDSDGIQLTVRFADQHLFFTMDINDDSIKAQIVYEFCNQEYEFKTLEVQGVEDTEHLKALYMNEFNRLLETDLVLFTSLGDEYCQLVSKLK